MVAGRECQAENTIEGDVGQGARRARGDVQIE
jgi:hypothetical protein